MKMKYLTIFLGLVLCLLQSKNSMAQHCISFDYDGNGNRVERVFYDGCDKNDEDVVDFAEQLAEEEFTLYPNPSNDFVTLSLGSCFDNMQVSYTIYDINGLSVKSGTVGPEETILDISGFLPGAYIVIVNASGDTFTRTIVKL